MAIYNLTNVSTADNFAEIISGLNVLSGNLLGLMLLVMIFIITYTISQIRSDAPMSFAVSSYITSIIAFFAIALGFIPTSIAFIPIVMVALATGMLYAFRET